MEKVRQFALLSMFFACIGFISCESIASSDGQLIFAHVIYRHGDRNPVDPYPTDPWKDQKKFWPEGYGQLTNLGKKQHYGLGGFFRKRYNALIVNGTYLNEIVYVQSTDVDRTLMSAESNLAGFFPPDGDEIWNSNIPWQPIPIHTVPEKWDNVLAAKRPCQRYDYAMKKYFKSREYKDIFEKFKTLFKYLEESSGAPVKTFEQAQYLYNTLFIETLRKRALPEWTKQVFVPGGDFEWAANFSFKIPTITTELARLKYGFLIQEILDRFSAKIGSTLSPDRNIWVYSGHDTTLAGVLNALQLFEVHSPPYTASLLFELYKSTANGYYIQLFYKNSTDENLVPLNIPSCGQKCSLENFRKIYETIIPVNDFEKECQLSMLSMTYEEIDFHGVDGGKIAVISLSLTVLVTIALLWKVFRQERNVRWYHRL